MVYAKSPPHADHDSSVPIQEVGVRRYHRGRFKVEDLVSAGGVVYRQGERGLEVVLCGRTEAGLWGLPKGTPNDDESIEETARREVREETGLDVAIVDKVGEIEYWFTRAEQGKRFHKKVHHFLMAPVGGSIERHDHEYDVVGWFPAAEAERMLTYENEAEILRRAVALLHRRGAVDAAATGLREGAR